MQDGRDSFEVIQFKSPGSGTYPTPEVGDGLLKCAELLAHQQQKWLDLKMA